MTTILASRRTLLVLACNSAAENAKHFPDDLVWQRHCAVIAAYRAAQLEVAGFAADAVAAISSVRTVARAA